MKRPTTRIETFELLPVRAMGYRAFTVDEANALIPEMEEVVSDLQKMREELRKRNEKLQVLDALWGRKLLEPGNPDHEEFLRHRKEIRSTVEGIEDRIEEEIQARGIRFPAGGLEQGLLDFPTTYQGRWVYLCWSSGESEIREWHEVDAGFRGRQPLTREQRRVMGRVDDPSDVDDSVLDF